MKILLLEEDKRISEELCGWLAGSLPAAEVLTYGNAFSFVTGLYDELKGEADLMLIHLKDNEDEYAVLARDMQSYFPHVKCIFFSEADIFAETVFQADPLYFFRLPMLDEEEVGRAFTRAERIIGNERIHSLTITKNRKTIRIRFESINYIESVGRKLFLYSDAGYYDTNMSMQEVLALLPDYFVQCHRSYIVNGRKISGYDSAGVTIKGRDRIPVSRSCKAKIEKMF